MPHSRKGWSSLPGISAAALSSSIGKPAIEGRRLLGVHRQEKRDPVDEGVTAGLAQQAFRDAHESSFSRYFLSSETMSGNTSRAAF